MVYSEELYFHLANAGVLQGNRLLQLLSGIIQWVHPPDATTKAIECGRSESDEDEDDTHALLADFEQIRKEIAEEKLRKVSFSQYAIHGALLSFQF
ncbi:hypothetical protein Tco_1306642 [Tanacetum coccineum]